MPLRAQIVAVVSSEDQADDDRVSLPNQVAFAREALKRIDAVEVADPISMWQSRDYYSLPDLRADSPEYNDLCQRAEAGKIDVIVGRDHSRVLGRTEAIQSALRNHLQLCRVQLYFYNAPVHPVEPHALGRRGRAFIRNRYIDAIAGVRDEEEVAELVRRRYEGMNEKAKRGEWGSSGIPFGYMRPVLAELPRGHDAEGNPRIKRVYGRMEPDTEQAPFVVQCFRYYLEGHGYGYIEAQLRRRRQRSGSTMQMMQNPAYVGVMVYGRRRLDVVIENGRAQKITRYVLTPDRKAELAEHWLEGIDARTDQEHAEGVILAWGQWKPIVPTELWTAVQHERRNRSSRPSASYNKVGMGKRRVYPLSGLMTCGRCGASIGVIGYRYDVRPAAERKATGNYTKKARYGCRNRQVSGRDACQAKSRMESLVRQEILNLLQSYSENSTLLDAALSPPTTEPDPVQEIAQLEQIIAQAERAIARWDMAFESEVLSLEQWNTKCAPHRQTIEEISAQLKALSATQQLRQADSDRPTRIREALHRIPQVQHNPRILKALLRRIIKEIVIVDGRIHRIDFL